MNDGVSMQPGAWGQVRVREPGGFVQKDFGWQTHGFDALIPELASRMPFGSFSSRPIF